MDIKLFNINSVVEFGVANTELALLASEGISFPAVSRLETITNKVVKFLLTDYGSDAFDTTYGSRWVSILQMSKSYLPKYVLTINSDIERCITYIKSGESSLPSTTEKLYTIKFNGLNFSTAELSATTEILLSITIYTTLGNKASFTLTQ